MAMDDAVAEADLADPNPDVEDLFHHYDGLYFRGALAAAGFTVQWRSSSSPQTPSRSFGSCYFSKKQNTITLSESILKYRSCTDLKNALLHEMIHAIIYVKRHRKNCFNHGPDFRAWMEAINSCCLQDRQRPDGGYNITTRHDFIPEEPHSFKGIVWKCRYCGDTLLRAMNQGPPSDTCCIENDGISASCGNMLCNWHNHKNECSGTYEKTMLKSEAPSQKKVAGGAQLLLTSSEMSKSKGAVQESSSSILQLPWSTKATKPNAEDKHLCLRSGSNGKPKGSSSSKKADKRLSPEMVGETSVMPVAPQEKPGQNYGLFATVKQAPMSVESPGGDTSKKAGKRHKPDDLQKTSVLPSAPQGTPKLKHALVATENNKLSSAECNDAKSRKTNTSKKPGEWHELQFAQKACSQPEDKHLCLGSGSNGKPKGSSSSKKADKRLSPEMFGETSVMPVAPQEKPGENYGLVATVKQAPVSVESPGRDTSKKVGKWHKPNDLQKTSVLPSASQGTPKLKHALVATENNKLSSAECNYAKSRKTNTSKKAGEWHELQFSQKACSHPTNPQKRLKQDPVAPEKKELPPLMGSSNEKLLDRSSSKKAYRQHEPEDIQETTVLPTAPGIKPMASVFVASEKQRKGKCKRKPEKEKERKPVKEKEYGVMSLWLNYYESDRSSGSPEPLVNKRTERRRRERERAKMLTYSRSKKIKTEPSVNSGTYAFISSHKIEMAAQVVTTANRVVVTPATGDQPQPSAPCLDVAPFLQPTDTLTSPDQSTAPDMIVISDDD